jgi:transcriptional regulator with XRE-family HTH domain
MYDFDEEKMKHIAYRLQYQARKKKLSYAAISRLADCSLSSVRKYADLETDEASMEVNILKRISKALEQHEYYLCNEYHVFVDSPNYCELIRAYRKKKSYSQKMLADKLGISISNCKHYEHGRTRLPYKLYIQMKGEL